MVSGGKEGEWTTRIHTLRGYPRKVIQKAIERTDEKENEREVKNETRMEVRFI